ncbi:MAG: hypothetical protein JO140_01085 [Candidatus Eremiobacteraeota bacterium]|nr:hypothetical protein [Candidatus Eremiobacteraeota bacterium]
MAAQTLIGYLPDEFIAGLGSSPATGIELPLEPGSETIVRIRHSQIAEARVGSSHDGYTALEIVLLPDASYELYAMLRADDGTGAAIFDPAFWQKVERARRGFVACGPVFRPDAAGRFHEVPRRG